ncbi:MAG: TlpA family protein disulfide reductase [Flavobacteriales bacterium]
MMKKILSSNITWLFLLAGIVIFYYFRYRTAPDIAFSETKVKTTSGEEIFMSSKIEGPTVVHFYASWCGPCLTEMRELNTQMSAGKLSELNFLFITDDNEQQIERISGTMPSQIQFLQVPSLKEEGIYTLPTTYFVNSAGAVVKQQVEPCDWGNPQFQQDILSLTK